MAAAVRTRRKMKVNYLLQDSKSWPDQMSMDEKMFARYAEDLEKDDFEDDIRGLSSSIGQLVTARRDTIDKLRASADYLDSIWLRCRVSKTMGTSVSVVGGGLTIAGGILTTLTAGAAAPVLIAGLATSSVGAAANIGTSLVEKILNSRQIKEMNAAFERDKDITLKLEAQIDDIKRYKDSVHLSVLLTYLQNLLSNNHILITILRGVLLLEGTSATGLLGFSFSIAPAGPVTSSETASSISSPVAAAVISSTVEASSIFSSVEASSTSSSAAASAVARRVASSDFSESASLLESAAIYEICSSEAEDSTKVISVTAVVSKDSSVGEEDSPKVVSVAATESNGGEAAHTTLLRQGSNVAYNPIDAGVFVEGGKVIGQNSFKVAGQVIIGISAAFLVWDAIDLGFTISDLVRKQGSRAAKVLREKATLLEKALNETVSLYNIDLPD